MKTHTRLLFVTLCSPVTVVAVLFLLMTPTPHGAPFAARSNTVVVNASEALAASPPVIFLHDPDWPSYAQTEITVFPEPPTAGHPSEICVWVINTSGISQTATIDLGFANFGSIGIQIGGIGGLAPERRSEIASYGLRAMLAGNLAAFTSAAIAGMLT